MPKKMSDRKPSRMLEDLQNARSPLPSLTIFEMFCRQSWFPTAQDLSWCSAGEKQLPEDQNWMFIKQSLSLRHASHSNRVVVATFWTRIHDFGAPKTPRSWSLPLRLRTWVVNSFTSYITQDKKRATLVLQKLLCIVIIFVMFITTHHINVISLQFQPFLSSPSS